MCIFYITLNGGDINLHAQAPSPAVTSLKGDPFHTITIELSLKPYKVNTPQYRQQVATELFTQWQSLLRHADTVAVMLWVGDGSEVLDYSGSLDQPMEWDHYMGNPNTAHAVGSGPASLNLHERAYQYMENPPKYTYGDLKNIIQTLRETGKRVIGKPIKIGATFDPGPEFATSSFKYKRHREILGGNAMGTATFVSCYSVLKADATPYAGFPQGIPDKTPFGTFFGRQSKFFLNDMGYDYIWFSNGFGFGVEAWSSTGAIFTGKDFHPEKLYDSRKKITGFWELFRKECPDPEIQTRGTNLSAGIDLARDGVDIKGIYDAKYHIMPPPNSPWAALDGDFGLEMVGYMSRIAMLPDDERYVFRYYVHDPWWVNSPWLDRYGSEPHDIFLPLSVARINSSGKIGLPTQLNILTADNSYGNMPTEVPDEVTPFLLKARYDAPTAPGELVWVYPFDEYQQWAYKQPDRIGEVYYGDWLIRQAINNGLPLNSVIATTNFNKVIARQPNLFKQSILVTIVPDAGSETEKQLINFVHNGGQLIVYGPADNASPAFKQLLNLKNALDPLTGGFKITSSLNMDKLGETYPDSILHQALFSGGGVRTQVANKKDAGTRVLVTMDQDKDKRDVVWVKTDAAWNGGKLAYVRGTNSASFYGGNLLSPHDAQRYFQGGILLRQVLSEFGFAYAVDKRDPKVQSPVLSVARHDNAYYFSGYVPNTTVQQRFKYPQGAPVFTGIEARLEHGFTCYNLPTAWHKECRFFVQQDSGIVSAKEVFAGEKDITRRIALSGLANATVRFYMPDGVPASAIKIYKNGDYPWQKGLISVVKANPAFGDCYEVANFTGRLTICW